MEIEKIKELMEMMKANDLSELEIVDGQSRIALKRGYEIPGSPVMSMPAMAAMQAMTPVAPAAVAVAPVEKKENLLEIKSPIVGTFYTAPSPNAEPFIKVGQHVDEETVVCIIEAMKVMNEVKSEVRGAIKKIMVANGQSVEYGQILFLVDPS